MNEQGVLVFGVEVLHEVVMDSAQSWIVPSTAVDGLRFFVSRSLRSLARYNCRRPPPAIVPASQGPQRDSPRTPAQAGKKIFINRDDAIVDDNCPICLSALDLLPHGVVRWVLVVQHDGVGAVAEQGLTENW